MTRTVVIGLILIGVAGTASAQNESRVGVTMGYPSAVGVLWQATDRIALRPEFTWTTGSSESSSSNPIIGSNLSSTPSSNWQTGVGLSALFYLSRMNGLGMYLTPRLTYSRTSTTTNVSGSPVASTNDGWVWGTSGAFGADYRFGRHFGVFGEVGLSYTTSTFTTSTVETISIGIPGTVSTSTIVVRSDSSSHSIGTRSGAGVIFFF